MPRAPAEANGRMRSTAIGSRPCSSRSRFIAAARSPAVSAKVPSRSNRTALVPDTADEVIDVGIRAEAVLLGDRVVRHADHLFGAQSRLAAPAAQLRGTDEALVV